MRSNNDIYNPSVQDFILKATASTYSRPQPARRVDQQSGSSGMHGRSRSTFNGKRVSNYQSYRGTTTNLYDGKRIEDAFWEKKPLQGRQITSASVLATYRNDRTSLRGGFFLQKLCLQNILHNDRKVTPDQVIQEFNRAPVQNNKCQLAIVRFKAECCLRGLPLKGQQVTPDEVVKGYQTARATLELARFKEECCRRDLLLDGQQVTPDAVVKSYQAARATLELARFKEKYCLRGQPLNGQQVTPDEVVKDYQAARATMELAHFQSECCLRGLPLRGQKVSPDAVVKNFPDCPVGKLGRARLKGECCLRGWPLNGQQVTPDSVVKDYRAIGAKLELGRFKAECCLKGLVLNGQQITPDEVVNDYLAANATLELARFKAECCLRGLLLNGQQITADAVIKDFPDSPVGKLGIARFTAECCLRDLALNGLKVTPDAVVKDFPDSPAGKLGIAHFKAECCLRGLALNGQQLTPDAVVKDYQAARATLALVRFKEQCCLKGLLLNGQQVTPDSVVKDFERGGWLLERAVFFSKLALQAKELNGNYLDNQKVLEAFNQVSGDHSLRQTRFLIQRLKQSHRYDEINEAQNIIQKAWQILNSTSVKDEQHQLQCVLKFMAMQNELTIDHQGVSAEQVLQSIKTLRRSFRNSRLHFFFLAHCYITKQPIDGREIHKNQVLKLLHSFPEGSKLRHALSCWFQQYSPQDNIMDGLLFQGKNTVAHGTSVEVSAANPGKKGPLPYQAREYWNNIEKTENRCATQAIPAIAAPPLKQWSKTGVPGFPDKPVPQLTALTLKTLEIIQEINGSYPDPPILITGSYARFLQNLCSEFNDIDIICTTEKSARILFEKLRALDSDRDSDIPKSIIICPIPGCQAIKLPNGYNIHLKDDDLGTRTMELQVSVDNRVIHEEAAQLAVQVPGVEKPVWCLSFAGETRLLNDTLEYLADNLDPLTEQLQKGAVFKLPRTILFNNPQNTGERIYGLLIRSLLTLNKARQFIALHSEGNPGKPGYQTKQLEEEHRRLNVLTESLQMKLTGHVCRHDFEHRVNGWLSTTRHVKSYEIKRKEFIKTLLAMMVHPEYGAASYHLEHQGR
ncbi:hypothetical protein [Endozoicomonas sp. YOMI1]|uniref:hypothetical protein n=1 Tax=Endozoicomonas sp. YOMI1 TaxID=2828739 RepID=UPI0021488FFD|nr:hypothetical protein [Endozoicomonas sp. YOMI1]